MSDISNLITGLGIIIVFLYYVRLSIKSAAKEELSNLLSKVEILHNRIESMDKHINVWSKNTIEYINQISRDPNNKK